jgi:hypothetical protein
MLHHFKCRPAIVWCIFASEELSAFSGPCPRRSGCAKNWDTCCGLPATDLTGCNSNPFTGLFCDWTSSERDKYVCFFNSVYEACSNKPYIACILCDKTTAFDCVSHEVLLSKLEIHKVTGIVLSWFSACLRVRRQRVSLDGTAIHCFQLDWESINPGVPQGSVLGPMLFNMYV